MKVSVIIPSYNRYFNLKNAIKSVEDQTYNGKIEILVCSDCSTDERYTEFETYKPRQENREFKYFKTKKNTKCPAEPRNVCLRNSTGEFISFLDDDDYYLPTKIDRDLYMLTLTREEMICSNSYYSDQDEVPILGKEYSTLMNKYTDLFKQTFNTVYPSYFTKGHLEKNNWITLSTVTITRGLYDKVGEFIKGSLNSQGWEDWNYWIRCLEVCHKCLFSKTPLTFYNCVPKVKWHDK